MAIQFQISIKLKSTWTTRESRTITKAEVHLDIKIISKSPPNTSSNLANVVANDIIGVHYLESNDPCCKHPLHIADAHPYTWSTWEIMDPSIYGGLFTMRISLFVCVCVDIAFTEGI